MNSKITFSSKEADFKIGSCEIKIPELSLKRGQEVYAEIKLRIKRELEPPKDYVQASSTLICDPAINFRKRAYVKIHTWFTADDSKDVDVTFFEDTNSGWRKVGTFPLTDKGYVEEQVKKLNNITAFLSKKSLHDVKISLKSYLFKKGRRVRACVGPDDEIFDRLLISEMKESGYNLIKKTTEKGAYGEKLPYLAADTKMGGCCGELGKLENFVEINEAFLDLKATPIYDLTERESCVIVEETPPVQDFTPKATMEFCDDVDANNIISNAENVFMDQRLGPSGRMESFTVDGMEGTANRIQITSNNENRHVTDSGSTTLTLNAGSSGVPSSIKFHGKVKANNIIDSVKNLKMDQRRYVEDVETPATRPVVNDGDLSNPMQVEDGSVNSDAEYEDAEG